MHFESQQEDQKQRKFVLWEKDMKEYKNDEIKNKTCVLVFDFNYLPRQFQMRSIIG